MRYPNIILGILCAAGMASAESLLLLPIVGEMDNAADLKTVNRLYRDVIESQFKGSTLPAETGPGCAERDCALHAAQEARADEVIYSTLNRLGSKWVFSSTLLKIDGSAFNQRLTALSVEDFEAVTQRMSDALLNHRTTEQVASLDNIVQKEEKEPERRRSLSASGVALGYLYPSNPENFNGYDQVIRVAFMNTWEMRNNLLLDGEVVWGVPDASIGADLSLLYVFNRSDYSPFLGGGVGLHAVQALVSDPNRRSSGPALNFQGGMLLFRTYDVHVMLRGQYQIIFNDDVAQGFGISAGFTFRQLSI